MAKNIFPSENSIGELLGHPTRNARERMFVEWMKVRGSSVLESFLYSGFTISAGAGLAVSIAAGVGVVDGYRIENDAAETLSGLANSRGIDAPNYIYAQLDFDVNDLVEGYTLVATTTTTPPVDSVLIGKAATAGGVVTAVETYQTKPRVVRGSYTGNGNDDDVGSWGDRFIFVGQFTPSFVQMFAPCYSHDAGDSPHADPTWIFSYVGDFALVSMDTTIGVTTGMPGLVAYPDSYKAPVITTNGFNVRYIEDANDRNLNLVGQVYHWAAFV